MRLPTLSAITTVTSKDRDVSIPVKPEGWSVTAYSGPIDAHALRALLERHPDATLSLEGDGRIAIRFADGATIIIPFTPELATLAADAGTSDAERAPAHSSSVDVDDGQVGEQAATPPSQGPGEQGNPEQSLAASGDLSDLLLQGHADNPLQAPLPFGRPLTPLGGIADETTRHGRDGLKHGEMGSTGHNTTTGVGPGLGHLTGLGDESLGRRNGESLSISENRGFPGESTGVGTGIDHLWLLGDTEYYKSSLDSPRGRDDDENDDDSLLALASLLPPPVLTAKAPRISGATSVPEDGHEKMPLEIQLANLGAEQIKSVVIGKPPAGTVIDWNHALPGTVRTLANGDIEISGSTSEIQALVKSLEISPPHNFSGTLPLEITVTVTAYGTTAVGKYPYPVAVTPIADMPDVSGDVQTTDEDKPVLLPNLAGSLNDVDGSEILRFEIRNVPAGASFQSGHVSPTDPTVWLFTPAEIAAGVTFVPPTDNTLTSFMKIRAIATEQANGDSKFAEDDVVVFVNPLNGPHLKTTPADTNEDTQVDIGSHITPTVIDPDGSERMVSLVISNVPATATLAYSPATGIRVVATPTSYTIEADPAYAGPPMTAADIEQAIKTTLATVKLTPPPDSDANISLSITMNTHDTDGSDYTQTKSLTVAVHAVADVPAGSGSGIGNEDTFIKVPVTVTPTDTDTSETIEFVEISGVPAGASIQWINADTSINTSGSVVFDAAAGTIRITGTTAEIQARALALQIKTAPDRDDDFTLSVRVGTIESNPTESGDIATLRNETTFNVSVTVNAVADPVSLGGSATVVEDHTVNFGAQITLAKSDANSLAAAGPSSETITGVVIHNVPATATVTYTAATGMRVVASPTSFTVEADPAYAGVPLTAAQIEQAVRDTVASFSLTPPPDSDLDITLNIDVTTVDRYGTPLASAPLVTTNLPFAIAVKADADTPTLALDPTRNAGQEDQPIPVGFTVGRNDTDPAQGTPSEAIQSVVIRDIPAGFTLSTTPTTPGNASLLVSNPDGSYAITGPNLGNPIASDAAINDVLSHLTLTPAPAGVRQHVDDDFTLHVDVTTRENNLGGGQVETQINTQTFNVPVSVAPVADAVTLLPSSTVVEDNIASVGLAIEAGLVKADLNATLTAAPSSETITQVVISGIPMSGAQSIAAIAYPGDGTIASLANVGAVYNAGARTITLSLQPGGTEQNIRDALKLVTLTPHVHTDVDIQLSVAVTTVDRWATAEASAPLVTTLPHTVIIQADASNDEPSVSGSASGVEDTLISLPITVTMQDTDGSETLSKVELTGIPHGASVTWAGLPSGAGATAIMSGADIVGYTFTPANTTYAATTALQSFLASNLKITPPADSGADFDLTVKAYNVESNLNGAGGSTGATPFGTGTIHVTVTPALDSVTLPATNSTVNEDLWVKTNEDGSSPTYNQPSVGFGGTINSALTRGADKGVFDAADTTEGIGRIVLGNLPKNTATYTDPASTDPVRVVVTEHPTTHIQTFTIEANPAYAGAALSSAALEAAIRATRATFTFTPVADDSTDVGVSVAVYTQDTDPDAAGSTIGLTLTASATHTIVVNARADTPTVQGDTATTNEDTSVALNLDAALRDHVGSSEVLSVTVSGVPSGASMTFGGSAAIGSSTSGGLTTYTLTGTEAAIRNSLANTTFTPTPQWSGTVNMTIAATATETGADDVNAFTESTADDVVTVSAPIVVTITPVVDIPTFAASGTILQENNNTTNDSQQLVIPLGTRLNIAFADTDGSQELTVKLEGIPTSATDGATIKLGSATIATGGVGSTVISTPTGNVTVTTAADGSITFDGSNSIGVISTIQSLTVQPRSDSDIDFTVVISGSTREPLNGASATFGDSGSPITHQVVIQAVADVPTVNVGASTKATVSEDSDWVTYPVTVALNDTDGTETLQSVRVQFSTGGSGNAPQVQFDPTQQAALFPNVVFTSASGQVTLTGPTSEIIAAMQYLQVKPGTDNGENITISVRAIAVESAPTEINSANSSGPGGAGAIGTEISIPTATRTSSFTIPVTPVPDAPTLNAPSAVSGTEDVVTTIAGITITSTDADGSETRYIEVKTSSFPTGTVFSNGSGTTVGTTVTDSGTGETWLRIAATDAASLRVLTPHDWSGVISLEVRGVIVDHSTSRSLDVTTTTASQTIALTIAPVADAPLSGDASQGIEDTIVKFGADIADTAHADHGHGVHVEDTTKGPSTEGGIETISQIELTVPADTASLTYTITHGAAVGTASIVQVGNVYTITSSIITGAADLGALTDAQRQTAEDDIRQTLATFNALIGVTHTDQNGAIQVTATTLDVKNGTASTTTSSYSHPIKILAVADTPSIDAAFAISGSENGAIPLIGTGADLGKVLLAHRSADTDGVADSAGWGSEVLSVELSGVPSGSTIGLTSGYSLPAGAALVDAGAATYRVTGANVDDINTILSKLVFNPIDFAGNLTLTVTAITTEQGEAGDPDIGSGAGISVKTATAIGTIALAVAPSVDSPTVKGNAIGIEDSQIAVPVSVTLADKDQTNGTETYLMKVANDLPTTTVNGITYQTKLYGAAGAEITLDADGTFHLLAADIAVLKVLPPLHYSSALQGDIVLHTTTVVTDTAPTGVATASFTKDIPIAVTGVADKPSHYAVTVHALEDQPIGLGHAIVAAAGTLTNALVDTDGSEKLSFVIGGLPTTVIPSIDAAHGRLDYIGGGKWSVSATSIGELTLAMESLTLPAKANFSGDNPYSGLTVEAVSQELDSDQATSNPWPVTIHVQPVLNPSIAIDGLSGWSPGAARSEDQASGGTTAGISLASVTTKTYVDNDGSEKVTTYDFDLSRLYSSAPGDAAYNAQIDARSSALFVASGAGTAGDWTAMTAAEKAQWFIDHHVTGTFTSHTGDASVAIGHIAITEAQLDASGQAVNVVLASGLAPSSSPFLDSNVDFTIPVTATIRDSAVISGSTVTVIGTQSVDFGVTLDGVADTPTVFAANPQNWTSDPTDAVSVDTFAPLELIPLAMGGQSTDTDVTQGRSLSENVYYVLSLDSAITATGPVTPPTFALTDGTGVPIGLDNGDGTWLIRKSDVTLDASGRLYDLSGNPINLQTAWFSGPATTLNFSLTSVAVENDTGDRATNSVGAQFAVIVDPGSGGTGGSPPTAPTIDMTHLLVGTEDTSSPVASTGFVTASAGTASVAVMFTLPAGATISNATYNPLKGRWVAAMDDVNNGLVHITPPKDFSGVLDIPVEAVATGTNLLKASTSAVLHMPVVPVADGVRVTSAPDAGLEDVAVSLHLGLGASPTGNAADIGEVDTDGSETTGSAAYVRLDNGATLLGAYTVVAAGDADATVDGHSVVGYARVPYASLATLQALPANNWHGTLGVTVVTVSTDQLTYTDPATGNPVSVSDDMASVHTFSVAVTAVADAPLLTVPATTPSGNEDSAIALSGLSAALDDTVVTNGGEILSVKISGVPSGTTFNFGSNNGDGSWTIPSDKLATLTVTPPLNFSGTMHLALEAYAIESSNGDTAHSSLSFDVSVTPVADTFEILAKDISVAGTGVAALDLNVRMVDQNALTGAGGLPTYTGETLPELIRMSFGSVPTGMFLVPSSGGEVRDLGSGSWSFTGTQAQANALQIASGPGTGAGTATVTISAVSLDGSSTLGTPITDTFRLTVAAPTAAGSTYTGTSGADVQDWSAHTGNDIMLGGAGSDTLLAGSGINRITGGQGSDTMTGGTGSDSYIWETGDDAGGALDVIINFQLGQGKDHLDLSRLLTGFSQQTSNLDNFVSVKADGQTIQIDASGSGASFHDVVTLQGAALTQSDLHTMVNNGNLIV